MIILAISAAFVAGTIAATGFVFAHGGDLGFIHACVKNDNGQVRIVGATETCKSTERPLDWAITGPPGPRGDKGEPGPSGTELSCDNQWAIQARVPEFVPDPSCLTVDMGDDITLVFNGGLCEEFFPINTLSKGGKAPVIHTLTLETEDGGIWEGDYNPTSGFFVSWSFGRSPPPESVVGVMTLTATDSLGNTDQDSATLTCLLPPEE